MRSSQGVGVCVGLEAAVTAVAGPRLTRRPTATYPCCAAVGATVPAAREASATVCSNPPQLLDRLHTVNCAINIAAATSPLTVSPGSPSSRPSTGQRWLPGHRTPGSDLGTRLRGLNGQGGSLCTTNLRTTGDRGRKAMQARCATDRRWRSDVKFTRVHRLAPVLLQQSATTRWSRATRREHGAR